jgi:hypothetical protein
MNKIELYKKLSKESIDSLELLEVRKEVSEGNKDPRILNTSKYLKILDNFDISEIVNNIEIFDEEELKYLKGILRYSVNNKAMCYKGIIDLSLPLDLSEEELRKMLSKYSITELLLLSDVLVYVQDEDLTVLYKVYNEVFNTKTKKNIEELDRFPYERHSIVDIMKKNNKLSDKEITYLHKLVDDVNNYLSSIDEDEYSVNNDSFNIHDYPFIEVQYMKKVLSEDIKDRKDEITKKLKH